MTAPAVTVIPTGVEGIVVELRPAPRIDFHAFVDCNMASAWVGERYRIFPGKYGEDPVWGPARDLMLGEGADAPSALGSPETAFRPVRMPPNAAPGRAGLHGAVWLESVYQDPSDERLLYAVAHNENYPATLPYDATDGTGLRDDDWPAGLRGEGSAQAVPRILLMRSRDGGESWDDLGVILEDRDERMIRRPVNRNMCFPGGVGDPSAVASGEYLYIYFGEYGYPGAWKADAHDERTESEAQCVSVARVPLAALDSPGAMARRWDGTGFAGAGDAPGRPIASLQIPPQDGGGPVSSGAHRFFWGPSVSWNESARVWVMLLGCVDGPYWAGDGVFLSINASADLGDADASQRWSKPVRIVHKPDHVLWYPSLQPTDAASDRDARRTSTRVGARSRLFFKEFAGRFTDGPDGVPHSYGSELELELRREVGT